MVSTRPPTSKSSRPFNNPLVTEPIIIIFFIIIIIIIIFWALGDGLPLEFEWKQISRTLSILADLKNVVVEMVSTRRLISQSSSPS